MIRSWLTRTVEPGVRAWISEAENRLAERLHHLESQSSSGDAARLAELEKKNEKLEKKLKMAMGAITAGATQSANMREDLKTVHNMSQQAMQKATSALSTAESAAQGVVALELAAEPEPSEPQEEQPPAKPAKKTCSEKGCRNKVRARGLCAKHYQSWKRANA